MSSNAIPSFQAVAPGIVPASAVARPATAALPAASNESRSATERPREPVSNLEQAVGELNRYVAGSRTDLQFRVDEDAGRVVVSIVDSESGQVLRQMPSEDALRIARYLESGGHGLLRQQA